MKKTIEVQLPDLFNLKETTYQIVMNHLIKNKRATTRTIIKSCGLSESSARRSLNKLVSDGIAKDLGIFLIGGYEQRVYEIK